ncbi:hypothetical protein [Nitrosomonas halophila]|nr:hypothetical protein [Nitrosomonas halophila]
MQFYGVIRRGKGSLVYGVWLYARLTGFVLGSLMMVSPQALTLPLCPFT